MLKTPARSLGLGPPWRSTRGQILSRTLYKTTVRRNPKMLRERCVGTRRQRSVRGGRILDSKLIVGDERRVLVIDEQRNARLVDERAGARGKYRMATPLGPDQIHGKRNDR